MKNYFERDCGICKQRMAVGCLAARYMGDYCHLTCKQAETHVQSVRVVEGSVSEPIAKAIGRTPQYTMTQKKRKGQLRGHDKAVTPGYHNGNGLVTSAGSGVTPQ